MKYYKLSKDLPTFKAGELFILDDMGDLCRESDGILAYYRTTISKFPNILEEWFEPTHPSIRDEKTRELFIRYLENHPNERFFQAIRNFADDYLRCDESLNCIAHIKADDYNAQNSPVDIFYWECDYILKEDDEIQS